jgi:signal transduction histidine kinase
MSTVESEFALSRDPRLSAQLVDHATSASPAWLWSADGSRILWANAVGAVIFGAANTAELTNQRFEAKQPAAGEIVRLAGTLPSTGQARLERLRGFGASFGRTLTCVCSRFSLPDASPAVLVIAYEPAGRALALDERVKRLFSDQAKAQAAFAPDGALLAATLAAEQRFPGVPTLSALGLAAAASQALAAGDADATTNHGPVNLRRLGRGASTVLLATLGTEPNGVRAADSAPPKIEPAPAPKPESPSLIEAPVPPPTPEPAASTTVPLESPPARSTPQAEPVVERRHPLRFVWQMDADGRFVVGSDEFIELTGPQTTAAFGRLWSEIAAELKLDPDQQVARAVATRETWSGITVSWPVDDGDERLPVELSGLPVFDRERHFRGYRGFGVCRDIARINGLAYARRERPIGFMARPEPPAKADGAAPATPNPVEVAAADTKAAAPTSRAGEEADVAPRPQRPSSSEAPAANVVLFRPGTSEPKTPSLSPVERRAFRELAQELTARLQGGRDDQVADSVASRLLAEGVSVEAAETALTPPDADPISAEPAETPIASPNAEPFAAEPAEALAPAAAEVISAPSATGQISAEGLRVAEVEAANAQAPGREQTSEAEVQLQLAPTLQAQREAVQSEAVQKEATPTFEPGLLDRIPIGVLIYRNDALLYANRHFLELTGYQSLEALTAAGWLNGLVAETDAGTLAVGGTPSKLSLTTLNGQRCEIEARLFAVPWGDTSALTLILTNGKTAEQQAIALSLSAAENEIRDLAGKLEAAKKSEEQLRAATREAQKAATAKAEFVGKVSHEIRTPLNAITGFTEVIMAERFGPIGNERYRDYLKDVHAAGMHIVALLNDLLDLSKIESGQLNLNFANVSLNELTQQCVGIMQPHASRARIIIRTSLTPGLPQVVADERSLRQIVLNLLSNSIKFTGPGGQVIVSTAFADNGEAVLRVRDTGVGMSEKDVEAALEPFRQTATAGTWGSGGTGLGLPLTKALAEANRAHFSIKSAPNAGTLIEVAFPPTRVVAQ